MSFGVAKFIVCGERPFDGLFRTVRMRKTPARQPSVFPLGPAECNCGGPTGSTAHNLQPPAVPPPATICGRYPPHSFRDRIGIGRDQARRASFRAPMINLQALRVRADGGPDILVGQAFAHFPPLPQETDLTSSRDAPNKMQLARREGQVRRQGAHLGGSQTPRRDSPLSLRGRQAVQRRGTIGVGIPVGKLLTLAPDLWQGAKMVAPPAFARPQPVEPLYQPVALGLAGGREDQFNPQVQCEPDKRAKPPRRALAPREGRV